MTQVTISKMTADQIPDLVAIENACFSRPWTYDGFAAELDKPSANFFTAAVDGRVCGYVGFQAVLDEGYVDNIAVLPEFRRRGVARALMDTAVSRCRELSLSFLSLEVRRSNSGAIALYEQLGFVVAGERKGFYSAPKEDALIMTLYFNYN